MLTGAAITSLVDLDDFLPTERFSDVGVLIEHLQDQTQKSERPMRMDQHFLDLVNQWWQKPSQRKIWQRV